MGEENLATPDVKKRENTCFLTWAKVYDDSVQLQKELKELCKCISIQFLFNFVSLHVSEALGICSLLFYPLVLEAFCTPKEPATKQVRRSGI